jgi:hypothetical protein
MKIRVLVVVALFTTLAPTSVATAQDDVPRAIRRDVPMTNAIRRAHDAGTRDHTGRPGPAYWQLRTDYEIDARLDPSTQTISGTETITLHNDSPDSLGTIVLRLDHNIFRDDVPRGFSVPAEETEGMVVTRLIVNGREIDLYARPEPRFGRNDPRNGITGLTQTVAAIGLEEPIGPHATATVDIEWHTKLPGGPEGRGHRMTQRWEDHLFQPTQWFPRIAKYDDLRGWDTNVYLGPAEFYNNFGRFDVRIDVPGGWIVSGTGILQNPEEVLTATARERLATVLESDAEVTIVAEDEPKTVDGTSLVWHFVADQVNDFAWAASPRFVWKATRATIPERGPVPIHMVHLPDRARFFERAGEITRHALEFYSALWAPYPFPQLTLQDGPSSGMEYPMVINSNQGAADHETAHQWWPMMVGNNETWYGWMDEGFNVYMNVLSDADSRGEAPRLDGLGQQYGQVSGLEDEPPMMWNANYGGPWYGFQTYQKAPMMLSMLGGIVGDEAVQAAMRTFTAEWSFRHPSPWDYAFLMERELGRDLGWFWYYWLWTTESVDGSIASVARDGDRTTVTVRQDGGMPSPVVLRVELSADGSTTMPNARMIDARTAVVTWPVDVWFDGRRTFDAVLDFGPSEVARVVFDPHCRFPDRDPSDNVWPATGADGNWCAQ